MATDYSDYPARLNIEYPAQLSRVTTAFRLILAIPIFIIILMVSSGGAVAGGGENAGFAGLTVGGGLSAATVLMLLFRRRYPRWWFDFQLGLARFGARVGSYTYLLRDEYPSTEDEQAVHLELDYPDAQALNRWLPLVKWLLAIPHFIVLIVLGVGVILATFLAWFAILFTGRYPRGLFDFVVGVFRWTLRVQAYAVFMLTDRYPPFSLKA